MSNSNLADILGKPNEGFHRARIPIIDIALWDTVGTIIIAYLIHKFWHVSFWLTLSILFISAQLLHLAFGAETKIIKQLKLLFQSRN
jgi:hypothetical protein